MGQLPPRLVVRFQSYNLYFFKEHPAKILISFFPDWRRVLFMGRNNRRLLVANTSSNYQSKQPSEQAGLYISHWILTGSSVVFFWPAQVSPNSLCSSRKQAEFGLCILASWTMGSSRGEDGKVPGSASWLQLPAGDIHLLLTLSHQQHAFPPLRPIRPLGPGSSLPMLTSLARSHTCAQGGNNPNEEAQGSCCRRHFFLSQQNEGCPALEPCRSPRRHRMFPPLCLGVLPEDGEPYVLHWAFRTQKHQNYLPGKKNP